MYAPLQTILCRSVQTIMYTHVLLLYHDGTRLLAFYITDVQATFKCTTTTVEPECNAYSEVACPSKKCCCGGMNKMGFHHRMSAPNATAGFRAWLQVWE